MIEYKTGKWATKIIASQKEDGSWGDNFHSVGMPASGLPVATEQAIGRLKRLGFTKEDAVIQKALSYMHDCLSGDISIPDYPEQAADFGIFSKLMLAVCIRRYTADDFLANAIAANWKTIVAAAFQSGEYDPDIYITAFYDILKPTYGTKKRHQQLFRLAAYYPVSLLVGEIDECIEEAYFDYVMNCETGYYYEYQGAVMWLPSTFASKEASRYLSTIELYCEYPNLYCKEQLRFVTNWLNANRNANRKWDMGVVVKDGRFFPLSDSWKTVDLREKDCTYRIERIISAIECNLT